MGKKQTYSYEIKMKAIEMKLAQVPVKEIMERLHIKNNTQIDTWMEWYRKGKRKRHYHEHVP